VGKLALADRRENRRKLNLKFLLLLHQPRNVKMKRVRVASGDTCNYGKTTTYLSTSMAPKKKETSSFMENFLRTEAYLKAEPVIRKGNTKKVKVPEKDIKKAPLPTVTPTKTDGGIDPDISIKELKALIVKMGLEENVKPLNDKQDLIDLVKAYM